MKKYRISLTNGRWRIYLPTGGEFVKRYPRNQFRSAFDHARRHAIWIYGGPTSAPRMVRHD